MHFISVEIIGKKKQTSQFQRLLFTLYSVLLRKYHFDLNAVRESQHSISCN